MNVRRLTGIRGGGQGLAEQVIVITGASSGIGLTTARMAADRGARVVLAARSQDALREATEGIEDEGHVAESSLYTRLRKRGRTPSGAVLGLGVAGILYARYGALRSEDR